MTLRDYLVQVFEAVWPFLEALYVAFVGNLASALFAAAAIAVAVEDAFAVSYPAQTADLLLSLFLDPSDFAARPAHRQLNST